MALYEDKKLNATTANYKDTNDPSNEGYRLTTAQWNAVQKEPDYNSQVMLAAKFDAENRGRTDEDEQAAETARNAGSGEQHQEQERYR